MRCFICSLHRVFHKEIKIPEFLAQSKQIKVLKKYELQPKEKEAINKIKVMYANK